MLVLTKLPSIRLQRDFRRIFAVGRRYRRRYFTAVIGASGEAGVCRTAFVVSKKIGKAVVRNRVKRQMRHVTWELLEKRESNRDIVVIAKPGADNIGFSRLHQEIAEILSEAGVVSIRKA